MWGTTALTTWRWRRRALDVAKNLVALVLAVLLCLAAVGLELNRQNAWYPSVDALLGRPAQDVPLADVGAHDAGQTYGRTGQVATLDERALPPLPSPGQRDQAFTVPSHGRPWRVDVLLPEGYFDPANAHRAYPVVVLAHGVPGSNAVWRSRMDLRRYADPVVAAHKVAPFIAVMPETTPQGLDTECVVGPDADDQVESWLSVDVPTFVKAHLRAAPQREAWSLWLPGIGTGLAWLGREVPGFHP